MENNNLNLSTQEAYERLKIVSDTLGAMQNPLFIRETFGRTGSHSFDDAKRAILKDFEQEYKDVVVAGINALEPIEESLTLRDYLEARAMISQMKAKSVGSRESTYDETIRLDGNVALDGLASMIERQIQEKLRNEQITGISPDQTELADLLNRLSEIPMNTKLGVSGDINRSSIINKIIENISSNQDFTTDMSKIAVTRKIADIIPARDGETIYKVGSQNMLDKTAVKVSKETDEQKYDSSNDISIMDQVEKTKDIFQKELDGKYLDTGKLDYSEKMYLGAGNDIRDIMQVLSRENPEKYFGIEKSEVASLSNEGVMETVQKEVSIPLIEGPLALQRLLMARATLSQLKQKNLGTRESTYDDFLRIDGAFALYDGLTSMIDYEIQNQVKNGQIAGINSNQTELIGLLNHLSEVPTPNNISRMSGPDQMRRSSLINKIIENVSNGQDLTTDMNEIAAIREIIDVIPTRDGQTLYKEASKTMLDKAVDRLLKESGDISIDGQVTNAKPNPPAYEPASKETPLSEYMKYKIATNGNPQEQLAFADWIKQRMAQENAIISELDSTVESKRAK